MFSCIWVTTDLSVFKLDKAIPNRRTELFIFSWDNAVAESFFKSLKTELIYGNKFITKQQRKLEIFEYIEIWYSKNRRLGALNFKTIEEFNNQKNIYKNVV